MSNASKPDGTDPRVLNPEGKTVKITKASSQSNPRVFHQPGCPLMDKYDSDYREVDISVARWKGVRPCSQCFGDGRERGHPDVTAEEAAEWRRRLASEDTTANEIASETEERFSARTIRKHAGENTTLDIDAPPVEHTSGDAGGEWHPVEDSNE